LAERDDPSSGRSNAVSHALFGDGYAGTPPTGTHSSLDAITYADLKRQAAIMTVPKGAHLTIAGMSDHDEALAIVEKVFGKWKGKLNKSERELSKQEHSGKAFVIDYDEAAQSALAVITEAGSDEDPNYFAEEVMNDKLGSSFTSRINMNLREDKGYTYGAASVFRRYQKAGYFGVYTNVKSEATGASIAEIFSELSSICGQRPLAEKERNEAVEGLLLGYPMQFDEVSSLGMPCLSMLVTFVRRSVSRPSFSSKLYKGA
jgi:zinc protease